MKKQVDVIIPVHNRPEHTLQTLESFIRNTDMNLANLYVVDDDSDEETAQALYANNEFYNLFINKENIGPGASRNRVAQAITDSGKRSKYLYHSDNDVFFTPGWLEKLINIFESANDFHQGKLKVLGASCHPYLQTKEHIFMIRDSRYGDYNVGSKDAVSGYSQLMTWETWDKYGPFDETMRGAEKKIMGSEDWAFCQKIIQDGFLVAAVEPEIVIPTGKTNTYGELATGSETFKDYEGVFVK